MSIKSIPYNPDVERLIEIAERVNERWDAAEYLQQFWDFSHLCGTHGYFNIVLGKVPDEVKTEAREAIAYAHSIVRNAGKNPETMFADEIVHLVYDIGWKSLEIPRNRRDRAISKLIHYQQKNNISALKNTSKLIGSDFIPYYEWVDNPFNSSAFMPTESDKLLLWEAKKPTLERILEAMAAYDWQWFKGYETESEKCSLTDFLEASQLAAWLDFEQKTYFISQKALESRGFAPCHESPKITDDSHMVEISFYLYATLPTTIEGDECLYFSAERQTRI